MLPRVDPYASEREIDPDTLDGPDPLTQEQKESLHRMSQALTRFKDVLSRYDFHLVSDVVGKILNTQIVITLITMTNRQDYFDEKHEEYFNYLKEIGEGLIRIHAHILTYHT